MISLNFAPNQGGCFAGVPRPGIDWTERWAR